MKQTSLLEKEPATEVMKTVAAKTKRDKKALAKVFSPLEIDEIIAKRDSGAKMEKEEIAIIRNQYRKVKRLVKDMEVGNKSKIILFPSITSGGEWYKMIEFSALYYVYRLAARMGRSARIYNDSDKFLKAVFTASIQNINTFIEQIKRLEEPEIEITEDGVYIFTLKNPLTDEELTKLRHVEEARRDKMYNIMKPKNMDPAIFQQILLISRQLVPRAKKLPKEFYNTTGEEMVKDIQGLMALYFDYSMNFYNKTEMATLAARRVNRMMAGVTILSENRIWDYDIATVIGQGIADLRRMIEKDLGN